MKKALITLLILLSLLIQTQSEAQTQPIQKLERSVTLSFSSSNTHWYEILSTFVVTNLLSEWMLVEQFIPGNGTNIQRTYFSTNTQQRFFVVRESILRPSLMNLTMIDLNMSGSTRTYGVTARTNLSIRVNYSNSRLDLMDWRNSYSRDCNYSGSRFDGSWLMNCVFVNANFSNSDFQSVNVSDAIFVSCNFSNVLHFQTVVTNRAVFSNCRF